MATRTLTMTVNGQSVGPHDVSDDLPMVDYLNDILGLTGTKFSCGIGVCHACVIIVDGPDGTSETRRTCINTATQFDGQSIRTIEGHAVAGQVSDVQDAMLRNFAFQCGYCTSGFVNEATLLLENLAKAPVAKSEVETVIIDALGEHICRCTGYVRYYDAIKTLILADPKLTRDDT